MALLLCCLFFVVIGQAQNFKLNEKVPLGIKYEERFKFAINKLIDSNYYIFKTDHLTHTEIFQSIKDTLYRYNLSTKSLNSVHCNWPKEWIGSRSAIIDFFVHKGFLYISFDKSVCVFKINWEKGNIKFKKKIHIGHFEYINGVVGDTLYFSSIYNYDPTVKSFGPHIGSINLKTKKTKIVLLDKRGVEFSHFPSKRVDFDYGIFLTSNVLDFKIRLFDHHLDLIDSFSLDSIYSNKINGVYYDYTKEGLQSIKIQDKMLFRIIKVYLAAPNKIFVVFKDSTCQNRNQFKLCVLEKSTQTSPWKISFLSQVINENETLIDGEFIPWLNSSSLYKIINNRLHYICTKNISINGGIVNESKEFCLYTFEFSY